MTRDLDEGWRRPTRFAAVGAILGAPLGCLLAWHLGWESSTATMLGCWVGALLAAGLPRPEGVWLWLAIGTGMALVYTLGGAFALVAVTWLVLPVEWIPASWWIAANLVTLAVVGALHHRDWRSPWGD